MLKKKNFIYFSALFICFAKATFLNALPSQVLIISNAETLPNGELSQKGLERAGALSPYFTMTALLLHFGQASAFFASKPIYFSNESTLCAIQTIAPTAESLNLPVHSPYGPGQETLLASFVLNNPRYDGQNVIIAWQQSLVSTLINAFGYSAPVVPIGRFDLTYILTFPITGPALAVVSPQHLLIGDL